MTKRLDSLMKFLGKGEKLAEDFPEESLNNMRKFAEVAIKDLGGKFGCLDDGKHWFKVTTQNLHKHLPTRLFYYIQHVQSMGNYGSHFQEDGVDPSVEDARYCVYAGQEVLQWIYPSTYIDPIGKMEVFIGNITDAVPCLHCEQPIGNGCVKKNGGPTAKNGEHTIRKKAYAKYRRNFQKHYNTTIADAMHEMIADLGIKMGEIIEPKEIRSWFANNYPAYTKTAVNCHSMMMATNLKTRHSHSTSKNDDDKYNLFFAEKKKFRLYDIENDPAPRLFGARGLIVPPLGLIVPPSVATLPQQEEAPTPPPVELEDKQE